MNVLAYLNHGRWIVDCPICGKAGATLAEEMAEVSPLWAENGIYVCPNCYPGISRMTRKADGRTIFNEIARTAARNLAASKNDIHLVVFPEEKAEIERIVLGRPPENRNWQPGESLDFLIAENAEREVE